MQPGLWADGWFYISTAGLLVSGALFVFLFGQYRAASEAAADPVDDVDSTIEIAVEPLASPVARSAPTPSPFDRTTPIPLSEIIPDDESEAARAQRQADGPAAGFTAAVTYLRSIKTQLDQIHREVRDLSKRVDAITERDDSLLERLGEISRSVAKIETASPPASAKPVPSRQDSAASAALEDEFDRIATLAAARKVTHLDEDPAPMEPAAENSAPAEEPRADETVVAVAEPETAPPAEAKPAEASPEPNSEKADEKPAEPAPAKGRRGPVWPV